jgi:hypothetical protein
MSKYPTIRGDHFRFGSVRFLSKKVTKPKFFFLKKKPKPNRNRVKPTGFGSVRFGFLGQKPVQTGLARFFQFWLGFLSFGSVFLVWLGFSGLAWFFSGFLAVSVRFGSVRLGFFLIKPKPNRNRVKPTGFGSVRFF